jgi:hypothetical protein
MRELHMEGQELGMTDAEKRNYRYHLRPASYFLAAANNERIE